MDLQDLQKNGHMVYKQCHLKLPLSGVEIQMTIRFNTAGHAEINACGE